ncbi:hypothetical protein MNBD_GAMMA01-470 [hydrothermal vent metagenome]|uniref:ABC transporter domain-containing protein n=1 Tax=hydrothermal vent metagenome TaxID=652676 RepID=A0A3B0UZL0_9ZZZZ
MVKLQIDSLKHIIRNQVILSNIQLNLLGFQVVTMLGPNGAGKSTLLKSLSATFYCQQGAILLNGVNSESHRIKYLSNIGYMPETAVIISELSVLEQLQLLANIKQVTDSDALDWVIETCKLQPVIQKRTSQLSLGYKQRLNLAQAIMNKPKLLIMDEPLNGLDPHLIIEFRDIIKQLKQHSLIIMSTHYLAEAQTISDRVLIMQDGKILDNIDIHSQSDTFDLEQRYMQLTAVSL